MTSLPVQFAIHKSIATTYQSRITQKSADGIYTLMYGANSAAQFWYTIFYTTIMVTLSYNSADSKVCNIYLVDFYNLQLYDNCIE